MEVADFFVSLQPEGFRMSGHTLQTSIRRRPEVLNFKWFII